MDLIGFRKIFMGFPFDMYFIGMKISLFDPFGFLLFLLGRDEILLMLLLLPLDNDENDEEDDDDDTFDGCEFCAATAADAAMTFFKTLDGFDMPVVHQRPPCIRS